MALRRRVAALGERNEDAGRRHIVLTLERGDALAEGLGRRISRGCDHQAGDTRVTSPHHSNGA